MTLLQTIWQRDGECVVAFGQGGEVTLAELRRSSLQLARAMARLAGPDRPGMRWALCFDDSLLFAQALLACARGELFGPGNAQLPAPPMLMMDRITEISEDGGLHGKGHVVAEFDITPDLWFFDCHFPGNPIMPGCLGLDGLWQLTGFNLGWRGWEGRGYALGVGEVKLTGMVRPDRKMLTYKVDFTKALTTRRLTMGVANGIVEADGEVIYQVTDMKVALSAT